MFLNFEATIEGVKFSEFQRGIVDMRRRQRRHQKHETLIIHSTAPPTASALIHGCRRRFLRRGVSQGGRLRAYCYLSPSCAPPQSAVARVDSAAAAAGSCVRLVAVSKLKPAADVQARPCHLLVVERRLTARAVCRRRTTAGTEFSAKTMCKSCWTKRRSCRQTYSGILSGTCSRTKCVPSAPPICEVYRPRWLQVKPLLALPNLACVESVDRAKLAGARPTHCDSMKMLLNTPLLQTR